jgi:hypothetical protein
MCDFLGQLLGACNAETSHAQWIGRGMGNTQVVSQGRAAHTLARCTQQHCIMPSHEVMLCIGMVAYTRK